ncbi:MAG: helix-turn-helix transcriptional regulator [Cardiobacteriaceae bacterium]|nr:helix-turn-helix transcriptional regulator [Cardiobacteriaceae bacterium]
MINFEAMKEFREKEHLTQEQLAEKLGLSRNGYAKIERGESAPSLERLDEIASALGVKVIELLKLEDKNVVCQISENHSNNHYYNSDHNLQLEIEKLKLIIAHKDEIIALKDEIIKSLQS